MKFYKPDGTKITEWKEFVEFYNSCYYLNGEKVKGASGKFVIQNSIYAEREIEKLIKKGIKNEIDIVHILAWKIGKIKHKESDKNNKFEYCKDWANAEKFQIKLYGENFDVRGLINYIIDKKDSLIIESEKNPQSVIEKLKNNSPDGIGTVYLITLLYFISKGTYPIYDRFAMMAVNAIIGDIKPGQTVKYEQLPGKNSKNFPNVIKKYEENYVVKLKNIFGDEYKNTRDIDRALWVYGHLFKSN